MNPQNAGPAPRIHYAEDAQVTEKSGQLKDQFLTTKALRVSFLVVDPSGQFETGDVVVWPNKLVLRNSLTEKGGKRLVELLVAPTGKIRYTLDGSEPREGTAYTKPITIGDDEVMLRAFAEASGLEAKADFRFPAKDDGGPPPIDPTRPARLVSRTGFKLDSRGKVYEGMKLAAEKSVDFETVMLPVGQGAQAGQIMVGEVRVSGPFLEGLLNKMLEKFEPTTPVTMTFRKAHFLSGHDLLDFAEKLGFVLKPGDIEQ